MRTARGVVAVGAVVLSLGVSLPLDAAGGRSAKGRAGRAEPERFIVPETDEGYPLNGTERALAIELATLWTRDAGRLVHVVSHAAREEESDRLTLLLAIAHAETNGRVLLVSEAGAVGLAQATPIAYLEEGLEGPLFVTADYCAGARSYFMKKPLADVARIARLLLDGDRDEALTRQAFDLLSDAFRYRREGVRDLYLLSEFAGPDWVDSIEKDDARNLSFLRSMEVILGRGAPAGELEAIHDRARATYRAELDTQRYSWKLYQDALTARRDALLRAHFAMEPAAVLRTLGYEAGAILARQLDDRFSPEAMARFLARHVERKAGEARDLGVDPNELEQVTTALYNGGGHNVKRMRSGLIQSLPETDRYSQKVPATRLRLDQAVEALGSSAALGGR